MSSQENSALDLRKMKMESSKESWPTQPLSPHAPPAQRSNSVDSEEKHVIPTPKITLSPIYPVSHRVIAAAVRACRLSFRTHYAYPLNLSKKRETSKSTEQPSTYQEYRKWVELQMSSKKEDENPTRPPRPASGTSISEGEQEDSKVASNWSTQRENNEAAKKPRDTRRDKGEETVTRVAFLEEENLKLKCKIISLENELSKYRYLKYAR